MSGTSTSVSGALAIPKVVKKRIVGKKIPPAGTTTATTGTDVVSSSSSSSGEGEDSAEAGHSTSNEGLEQG